MSEERAPYAAGPKEKTMTFSLVCPRCDRIEVRWMIVLGRCSCGSVLSPDLIIVESQKGGNIMGYFKAEDVQMAADRLAVELEKKQPYENLFPVLSLCLSPLDDYIERMEKQIEELKKEKEALEEEVNVQALELEERRNLA